MTESTEENQESPIKPTVQDEGIGALTSHYSESMSSGQVQNSSAPVKPTVRRSRALVQSRQ